MDIELQGIGLSLGGQQLFDGYSHTFPSGNKVLLHGPSGSGKSTLLRLLLGFVQPDTGAIFLGGEKLTAESIWALRRRMAYVPQTISLGEGSVEDFFDDLFAYQANKDIAPTTAQINQYLHEFQLPQSTLAKPVSQLSGGERQRVAVVAALLLDREVYLLDEATAALDDDLQQKVIQHFAALSDCTVIAVSHQKDWPGFDRLGLFDNQDRHE